MPKITRRAYDMLLGEFVESHRSEPRPGLSKAVMNDWASILAGRGLGSSSINSRLRAVRKLATKAADIVLIADAIGCVKGAKCQGVRLWRMRRGLCAPSRRVGNRATRCTE